MNIEKSVTFAIFTHKSYFIKKKVKFTDFKVKISAHSFNFGV